MVYRVGLENRSLARDREFESHRLRNMKYLGIDFGTRRIGLAVSDALGTMAFPHAVLPNDSHTLHTILTLTVKEGIEGIVIGHSLTESGANNSVQRRINEFVARLEEVCSLPIFYEDERMTSHNASLNTEFSGLSGRRQANTRGRIVPKNLDARAAALILQRYLDKR